MTADLDLLHLDPLAAVESAWTDFTAALNAVGAARNLLSIVGTIAGIDAGELTGLPGVEEFLVLRAIRDAATAGRWRQVVVDLSGFGDPYAVLRAPTVLATTIDRLWPRHLRLAEASEKPALAQLAAAVEGIDRDCQDLGELLTDPHGTSIHLVEPGGERGRARVPDDLATAELMGLPLRSVQINAGPGGLDYCPVEAVARDLLGGAAGSAVHLTAVATAPAEPTRAAGLRKLGVELPPPNGASRGSATATVVHVSGDGVESEYELSWPQTLPDPQRLTLGRSGDDLLVTIAGFRQPVRLPSVLQRCLVAGATWEDGRLAVRFRPNPAIWPQPR